MHEVIERLLTQHGAALRARAQRWSPEDPGAQDDLMQRALQRLWESHPELLLEPALTVRARLLSFLDEVAHAQLGPGSGRPAYSADDAAQEARPSTVFPGRASIDVSPLALTRCLDHLSANERSVLQLVLLQELGSVRAAEALGLQTATVWGRLRRALARLRTCLGDGPGRGPQEVSV